MRPEPKILHLTGDDPIKVLTQMEKGNVPTLSDSDLVFFNPQESMLAVQCCDCGLVHHFEFLQINPIEVGFRVRRDEYTTLKYRMNNGIIIKHKEKLDFFRRLLWKSKLLIMSFRRQNTTKK